MTVLSAMTSFALIAGLLTILPGLDTALVIRATVTLGRREGYATALGICTGVLIWGAATAVGVSALLAASRLAYGMLRLAGAVYLIWLGAAMLWASRRRRGAAGAPGAAESTPGDPEPAGAGRASGPAAPAGALRSWSRGLATNLLNPKVGVFYVAMLPQFVPTHTSQLLMGLLLASVHDAEGIAWFTLLIGAVQVSRRWLSSGRAHRVMDRITGAVLIGFGLRLALARR